MLLSPDRANEYRDRARLCIEAANHMASNEARAILLDLAFHWIKLSEQRVRPDQTLAAVATTRSEERH
ncbi:MAG TPA: hypothetical protein VKS78_01380 [Roseiarcus sp.]|nr:hypothetical protein [Roseiarcus sp.]